MLAARRSYAVSKPWLSNFSARLFSASDVEEGVVEIGVDQAVPHPDHGGPGDVRMALARLGADLAGRLTDDLEGMDEGEREHVVGVEVLPAPPAGEPDRRVQRVDDVAQTDAVIRLHPGPSTDCTTSSRK